MTFIGIACKGDSAEVVTDTVGYTNEGARFRQTSKQHRFDHLNALLMTSGNGRFARHALWHAEFAANNSDSFDQLVETAPHWLEYALRDAEIDPKDPRGMAGTVCFVGYSDRAEEYAAYACHTTDLKPKQLHGTYLQPAPYSLRPTQHQLKTFVRGLRALGAPDEDIEDVWRDWSTRPQAPVPASDDDWINLAELARKERSRGGPAMRVWVAGTLTHTRLSRGETISRVIWKFNDEGEELAELLAGSLHPISQVSPCADCDSGLPAIDCHLKPYLAEPCECGSGDKFEDCCMVQDRSSVQQSLWTKRYEPGE